ncbi:MAG: hypothetical protein R3E95_11215 [Thiolinea sp.]
MDNEPTSTRLADDEREKRLQMEWERLQNEAIAAQRWRLEQERAELERQQAGQDQEGDDSAFRFGLGRYNRLMVPGLVALILGAVLVVAYAAWN